MLSMNSCALSGNDSLPHFGPTRSPAKNFTTDELYAVVPNTRTKFLSLASLGTGSSGYGQPPELDRVEAC